MVKTKVGIVGYGFVGMATKEGLKDCETFLVDPKLSTTIQDLTDFNPKIVFVCVPTPMSDSGSIDSKILEETCQELSKKLPKTLIIVKSTVIPDIISKIVSGNSRIILNPEFLREKTACEDFINSKLIIFGGNQNACMEAKAFYKKNTLCKTKDYQFTTIEGASFIKYAINTFLSTKVIFFNELFNLMKKTHPQINWDDLKRIIQLDERIGNSHMDVPGHDGKFGYGGACFPKDTKAFLKYSEENNSVLKLLERVIEINNKIRSSYSDLDEREREQNVKFL